MTPSPIPLEVHAVVSGGGTDPLWLVGPPVITLLLGVVLTGLGAMATRRREDRIRKELRDEALHDQEAALRRETLLQIESAAMESVEHHARYMAARVRWLSFVSEDLEVLLMSGRVRILTLAGRIGDPELTRRVDRMLEASDRMTDASRREIQRGLGLTVSEDLGHIAVRVGELLGRPRESVGTAVDSGQQET